MEITVNIKAPELAQAMLALAGAFCGHAATMEAAPTAHSAEANQTRTTSQPDKPRRQSRTPQQEEPKESKQEEKPASERDEVPQVDTPTVVELRAKAQAVGTTPEAKKAIKALLDQFGAKSISDVPEDNRADFLAELDLV